MRRLAIFICVAACGRIGFEPGRALPDDAPAASGCWDAWTNGPLRLGAPRIVEELRTSDNAGDPWLSPDALALYFGRGPATKDYHVARRPDRSSPWGPPVVVAELSSPDDETKLTFTEDELLAIWSSDRGGLASFDLWQATRTSPQATFDMPTAAPLAALNDNRNQYDPHVSSDGLRLYYAPGFAGGSQQVMLATRSDRTASFGAPVPVVLDQADTADPALSPDELVMVYAVPQSTGQTHMFHASRAAITDAFGPGQELPLYTTPAHDQDPAISYDGCELYFSSTRVDPAPQLYVTVVQ